MHTEKIIRDGRTVYMNVPDEDEELPEIEINEELVDEMLSQKRPLLSQVQERVKELKLPIDKLSNCCLWNYDSDEYADIIQHRADCYVKEGIVKGKQVVTPYFLELIKPYVDLSPLTPFHREILFHAINLQANGYNLITFSMTLDSMTGGVENRNLKRNAARFEAIKSAIEKLAHTAITVDLKPLLTNYPQYMRRHTLDKFKLHGPLLPCRFVDAQINGQKILAVELNGESPLMYVAKVKNQLLRYSTEPLAIAGQKNTPQVMTIKNYLLRRIELMKQRNLSRTILFESLYRECGLTGESKTIKQNARKEIEDTLTAFKAGGVIKDFEFERKVVAYRAIKILLD
ncbi:MAG: hypothetical protein IJP62_08725 [Treponema sp.]|nr:hypothetical protein [Treponema sp.]